MTAWPWCRRRSESMHDAEAAEQQAQRASADADQLASRVDQVAEKLAQTRRNNHFGLAVERSIRRA